MKSVVLSTQGQDSRTVGRTGVLEFAAGVDVPSVADCC